MPLKREATSLWPPLRTPIFRQLLVADVISGNRKLIEDLLYRVRSIEMAMHSPEPPGAGETVEPSSHQVTHG